MIPLEHKPYNQTATSHKQLIQAEERHDFTEPLPSIQIQNETTKT